MSASDRAYTVTKELVLTGELPGGLLFGEGDIASRLGVSRTPVREAFLRLQSEGLLELIPKRGVVVVPVPPGEAEDVLDAREAVEGAAVRRLAAQPDLMPEAIDRLRAALAVQRERFDAGDLHGFASADEAFHRSIVEAGRNALLIGFYATLADRQRRMSIHALAPAPDQLEAVLRDHEDLIALIERGDHTAFAPALRTHLTRVHRR